MEDTPSHLYEEIAFESSQFSRWTINLLIGSVKGLEVAVVNLPCK